MTAGESAHDNGHRRSDLATRKLLILGATGATGRHVVAMALERGIDVTVLVRQPEKIGTLTQRLRVLTGSVPDDPAAVAAAVAGQDAVISTLGVGTSLRSGGLIQRSMPVVVEAMRQLGVRRLIITSAYGVGATWRDVPPLPRVLMKLLFRDLYDDKAAGEDVVRRSGLDWTLVYPVTLTNGPPTRRYRTGERLRLRGMPRISRADVAHFLVGLVDDTALIGKGVLVSG
jgi:putative NADH-flavin reductase